MGDDNVCFYKDNRVDKGYELLFLSPTFAN